jgi:hypothetical protein
MLRIETIENAHGQRKPALRTVPQNLAEARHLCFFERALILEAVDESAEPLLVGEAGGFGADAICY